MNNLALINYYIKSFSIYEALICVATILWIVTLSTTGQTLYGSLISEYVVLILAMLLIIFIIFVSNLNTNVNKPNNINVMLIRWPFAKIMLLRNAHYVLTKVHQEKSVFKK
jgi:hypothetical protein